MSELSGVTGEALVNVLVMTGAAEALSLIGGSATVVHNMTGGAIDILVLHIRRQAMGIHYEAILVGASLRVDCLSCKRFVAVVASETVTGVDVGFFQARQFHLGRRDPFMYVLQSLGVRMAGIAGTILMGRCEALSVSCR